MNVGGVLKDGQIHSADGGTSGAAALTSGGIALLRSRFPNESRTDILKRVFASVRDAGPSGKDDATGYGVFRPVRVLNGGVPHSAAYDKWAGAAGGGRTHAAPKKFTPGDQGAGNKIKNIAEIVVPALILAVIAVGGAMFFRARQRRRAGGRGGQPPYGAGGPGQGGPGQYQQGPPPSFGPPQNPGPPPGEGRPAFRPPPNQGPPERR